MTPGSFQRTPGSFKRTVTVTVTKGLQAGYGTPAKIPKLGTGHESYALDVVGASSDYTIDDRD